MTGKLKTVQNHMFEKIRESEKIEIVVYKSSLEKARNLFRELEEKQDLSLDPITKAKRTFRILEEISRIKKHY